MSGCRRKLATGQWWVYCGETDMDQSSPALCTDCGGELKLDPNTTTDHPQCEIKIHVDIQMKNIIQTIINNHGCIIPIASCQDDLGSGEAYVFLTTMSIEYLNDFVALTDKWECDLYEPDDKIPIPRWRLSWNKEYTRDIEDALFRTNLSVKI